MVRGVVVCAILLLAGCGDEPVTIEHTEPDPADTARCEALIAALPDEVADQKRRLVSPAAALGAGWGDPAIVLTCGGDWPIPPAGVATEADGVGWYVPDEATDASTTQVVLLTIGWSPVVRLELPAEYGPPAQAMVDLAPALKQTLEPTP